MQLKYFLIPLALCACVLCLSGCYQAHSDDDLRTVPVTNNPNVIGDTAKGGMPMGIPH